MYKNVTIYPIHIQEMVLLFFSQIDILPLH